MLKTNAVARHSNKSTVRSPYGHHSRAVRVVVQTPSSVAFAQRLLYYILCDVTYAKFCENKTLAKISKFTVYNKKKIKIFVMNI